MLQLVKSSPNTAILPLIMQLKLLAYLTTATTLVLGSTLTVENVVTMVSTFGSKTAALHEELEAIHAGSSIFDVFVGFCHLLNCIT